MTYGNVSSRNARRTFRTCRQNHRGGWIPVAQRNESRNATSAPVTSECSEHAATTYAISDRTVEKLEVERARTVNYANSKRSQSASFKSEWPASRKFLSPGNTQLYLSPNDVMNIEELPSRGDLKPLYSDQKLTSFMVPSGSLVRFRLPVYSFLTRAQARIIFQIQLYRHQC